MASENETPVKKAKSGTWDNIDVFRELSIVFYNRLDNGGGLTPEFKEAVAAYLGGRGHDVSWNALRTFPKMSRVLTKWDEKTHEDILIEVFHSITIPQSDLTKIMEGLHAKGHTFSESALR
ncbi:uncharacterized protein F5Z01DRAFT_670716 [Emericellopsis atlantica]|uniref:Uncharacterized protein n=1 Tax=Emericellopsis atlantica TaxID=2614577 RepID=A0A9P7ZTH1_9HYPO|nr:uncharacterized protein F5Z01DRAFT_670716 [Emericellopsis atlantica]KAG9258064.1 hypothetical protein F5Z01DRAFT_670716 [Emericellopsis atlantica]